MDDPIVIIISIAALALVGIGFLIKHIMIENNRKAQNIKQTRSSGMRKKSTEIELEAKDNALTITQKPMTN